MPVRTVTTSNWKISETVQGMVSLEVTVSAGTYVRALARDIGKALGVPAVADSIRRLCSGVFSVDDASVELDCSGSLLTMGDALRSVMKTIPLTEEETRRIANGMAVSSNETNTAALLNHCGRLIAIGFGDGLSIVPKTVFIKPEEL